MSPLFANIIFSKIWSINSYRDGLISQNIKIYLAYTEYKRNQATLAYTEYKRNRL